MVHLFRDAIIFPILWTAEDEFGDDVVFGGRVCVCGDCVGVGVELFGYVDTSGEVEAGSESVGFGREEEFGYCELQGTFPELEDTLGGAFG